MNPEQIKELSDYAPVIWCALDVHYLDESLTVEQCKQVIDAVVDNHQAEYGICWDDFNEAIDALKQD